MKASELRKLIREEVRKVLKEAVAKSEQEFFMDIQTKPNGKKAVEKLQEIDPTEYDTADLTNQYQTILDRHKINIHITNLNVDSEGNVSVTYN